MAVQRGGADKWKLKKWFSVHAPKVFNEAVIGELPANDEKVVLGRNLVVNLDAITHNPDHAYTNVLLKITGASGDAVQTKLLGIELLHSYLRSFVRRYRSVSTAVIPVVTKDGTHCIAKLIAITRSRTAHTKIVGARKAMVDYTITYFKENEINEIINTIISGSFQAGLAQNVRHIVDMNKVEVRKLEIKNAAKPVEMVAEKATA